MSEVERLGKIKTKRLEALIHCINAIKDNIDRTKKLTNMETDA